MHPDSPGYFQVAPASRGSIAASHRNSFGKATTCVQRADSTAPSHPLQPARRSQTSHLVSPGQSAIGQIAIGRDAQSDPRDTGATSWLRWAVIVFVWLASAFLAAAATFNGNAHATANDPTNSLSWNATALTVSCWFRISVPSGTNVENNMTLLVNRQNGDESSPYAYLIRFNVSNGNIEFATRGPSSGATFTLIQRPYLERWYHVAVKRAANTVIGYVDGRAVFTEDVSAVGDSATTEGISVGGWGGAKYFYGDIQEVAIYQRAMTDAQIFDRRFRDQTSFQGLNGYYKLGFNTNAAVQLNNFAPGRNNHLTASGPAVFEETDQAGEQSAFDARRNRGDDAIAPLSGAFAWEQVVLARPIPGIAFDLHFGYSTASASPGAKIGLLDPYANPALGLGWRHTFETRLIPDDQFQGELLLMRWDGSIETWTNAAGGVYRTRHREYRGELVQTNGGYEWTTPERLVYRYRGLEEGTVMSGRLDEIRDFNGNRVQVLWNQDEGLITNVVDTTGGRYAFHYDSRILLTNVTFGQWQVRLDYDATNRLTSKTLTNTSGAYTSVNTTWQFQYNTNGLLERLTDPRTNTSIFVQYDQYGRKTNELDALNWATQTRYGVPGKRQITHIDPGANTWIETYDRKGHITAQQNPLTNITSYTYDTNGNRLTVTEPLGWTTYFGYDSRANVIARTNALGEVTRWNFHPFFNKATNEVDAAGWTNFYALDNNTGNLLSHSDALGTLVTYTYRTNGLVDTATDANGRLTGFDYDTNGFLISRVDAATNTWTYTYNDVGWKTSEANPLGEVSTYSYNLNGNVVLAIDPLFRHFTKNYDPNGNLLSESDGKGQFTTYAYDAANQRTNMTDRTGTNKWTYAYTSRGKLAAATDPQTNTVTQVYDAANRLVSITDPLGGSITNLYDANGNLTVLIDKVGQRWAKTYDRLNRTIAEADPQGDTRQTTYDEVGRIKVVTTPNGHPSTHTYDGRGRLTKWKDAEGFDWLYAYDGNANITNITDALLGHYVMTYGPRNERLSEVNQESNQWTYVYDELLRLQKQTDPNSTTRTLEYDPGGRVLSVQFSTGRKNSMVYDFNNNVTVLTRRVGLQATSTQLAYDSLDRVITQTDAFQQTIRYGYDSLSRVTSLTYPDNKVLAQNYDPLGRLTNQVNWAGRQMNYTYDKAGRLIRRAYPNDVVQTNTFDSAGRLTGLSHSTLNPQLSTNTISIALTYAYDRNGNKVGNTERGTFAWPMPSLVDETSRFTASGRITNRVDALNPTNNFAYQYDASGNMTNVAGGGQTWRLTYDEDNRTTSIHWDCGMAAKIITNRYDALGRRIARKVDNQETRYVLDLSGNMERILCDLNPDGTTNWYVHGPDLAYVERPDGSIQCFHADATGNVTALTGTNGTLLAQYAYTPYGRSLGSTNCSQLSTQTLSQPFLFVGSQGVMEDLPGLYFMRARYYSAEAGVFLSTDPVKNIGPGWKPNAFSYTSGNPLSAIDPNGEFLQVLVAAAAGAIISASADVLGQAFDKVAEGENPFDIGSYDAAQILGSAVSGAIQGGAVGLLGPAALVGINGVALAQVSGFAGEIAQRAVETYVTRERDHINFGEAALENLKDLP